MNNNNEVDVLRVAAEKMMAAIAAKLLDEGNPERWMTHGLREAHKELEHALESTSVT